VHTSLEVNEYLVKAKLDAAVAETLLPLKRECHCLWRFSSHERFSFGMEEKQNNQRGDSRCALAFTRYSFTSKLLCTNQSSYYCPPPLALPTPLQYDCTTIAQYTPPPPPPRVCTTGVSPEPLTPPNALLAKQQTIDQERTSSAQGRRNSSRACSSPALLAHRVTALGDYIYPHTFPSVCIHLHTVTYTHIHTHLCIPI